jgi:NitT/TauT family transport system substrate-binding protein
MRSCLTISITCSTPSTRSVTSSRARPRWDGLANHKEAAEIVARFLKRPPAVLEEWLFTKKDFYRDLDGKPDLKVIQESIEKVKELGFIKETVDASKYADLSLIEEATRRRRNGN